MDIRISALIVSGTLLTLLIAPHDIGSVFATTKLVSIQGEGFGNDGWRFKSFVDCSNQQHELFQGGSHTFFTVDSSNKTMNKGEIGRWNIEYKTGELPQPRSLSQSGYFTNEKINGSHYSLNGFETIDTVCGGAPTSIIISGQCGENNAVNYQFGNGQKIGSTVPPYGGQVQYLFGSEVRCTAVNS